jgi:hypothetical protein|tara:strand:+ start:879 stop:2180 length:1302 start_codon:yes stop_codon:yes gene_type:complete
MALIDLKTNLANLKNVDNIDNTYQDGFTPNRKTKSPTEFKNNTSQLGTGENVDYDRKDLSTERISSAESNYDKFKPDNGQFIQKDIGERYRNTNADGGLFRGGIALQAERTLEDAKRVGKFLGTSKGKIFTLKQFYLQSQNASKNTRIYNPLSLLVSLPNNISQQRHVNTGDGSLGGFLGGLIGFPSKGKSGEGAVTLFSKDRKKKLQVSYGGKRSQLLKFDDDNELPEDFIKFRIRDAVNGKWIIFPALVSGITDNSSQSPTAINYIGRPDSVYVYGTMDRTIGFNLKVVALNKGDIETIWEKVNYLKGLVQPQFKQFFTDNEDTKLLNPNDINTRPVAPIIYLTIGDMFVNTPGFFKSVNITIPDNTNWELEKELQFPHICDISLDFQYIGKETPTMLGKNYEGKVGANVVNRRTPPKPAETTTTTESGAN